MPLLHLILVALVQGVTEFLPISSSGHLILLPQVVGAADQGLVIDIAVHVGTLLAAVAYFRRDFAAMAIGIVDREAGRAEGGAHLLGLVVLATLPLLAVGWAVHAAFPNGLRDPRMVAWACILGGGLLYVADRVGASAGRADDLGWRGALLVGAAQVLALVPGTSRSGITITAGRLLGLTRAEAARFALLLAVPAIAAAGAVAVLDLVRLGDVRLGADAVLAAALSCVVGYAAIAAMMHWLRRASFTPFVLYRVGLGLIILAWQ